MRERVLLSFAGVIVGVWAVQSVVGTFNPTLRPDPVLTAAIGPVAGASVAALIALWARGNGKNGDK